MARIFHPYLDKNIGTKLHLNKYYISKNNGGLNKYRTRASFGTQPKNQKYQNQHGMKTMYSGCVLQNCTGYACGRFMECQGITSCTLPNADAGSWFGGGHGYETGKAPRLGAVLCWSGHVAIVEKIYSNTDVVWSESNYSRGLYFDVKRGNPSTYYDDIGYKFKGYIYPTELFDGEDETGITIETTSATKYDLNNIKFEKGYYSEEPEDKMRNNAIAIYLCLKDDGWEDNPIYAVLGNFTMESKLDPSARYTEGSNDAIGLAQWDPHTKWTNWAKSHNVSTDDGFGQMDFFEETHANEWFAKDGYNLTWEEFKHDTTHDVEYLTRAFEREYERSGDYNKPERMARRIKYSTKWANWFKANVHDVSTANYPSITVNLYGGVLSGDFSYTKPNNKHFMIMSAWL